MKLKSSMPIVFISLLFNSSLALATGGLGTGSCVNPHRVVPANPDHLPMRTVTLEELVRRVSNDNFNVYANALRVYQAKEGIEVARMNLLPRLNIWNIASVAVDGVIGVTTGNPMSVANVVLNLIQDIAPFLVPANWFRLEQSRVLFNAEQEGYRALWSNEVMTAKALYIHLLLDESLLAHIKQSQQELDEVLTIVRTHEMVGGAPQGTSRDIEIRSLALLDDKRALESLVAEERGLLSYMMALPENVHIRPQQVEVPNFEQMLPLVYDDFEFRAVDSAPEIRQFDHFISASDSVRQETLYSFLGTSTLSRGAAGGVFDNLPRQQGLGFGTPASVRIVSAQKEIMRTQRRGIEETIKRQLRLLITNYNMDLENYTNLKRRLDLTCAANTQLYERLQLGHDVDAIELIESSRNHIQADTAYFAVQYRFITNEDKLARLIFHGDYSRRPVTIESVQARR